MEVFCGCDIGGFVKNKLIDNEKASPQLCFELSFLPQSRRIRSDMVACSGEKIIKIDNHSIDNVSVILST